MKKIVTKKSKANFQRTLRPEKLLGNEREGIIIAHFGASAEVEDDAGAVFHCHLRKNLDSTMTGDRVLWRLEKEEHKGVVVSLLPRRSLLVRPETNGKIKLIAANVDAIVIVSSPPPPLNLIDRFIVAAENVNIQPIILINKIDLLTEKALAELKKSLSLYEKMGYPVIFSSTYLANGLNQLKDILTDKTCVLVGVSGVGKSSIIAALTGLSNIVIGELAAAGGGLGKHTTTTTRLYHLGQGGNLIDSPGVREFTLWHLPKEDVLKGYVDFLPYLGSCQFRNCQHNTEQGCALLQAVSDNQIDQRRWDSYQQIVRDTGR